MVAEQPLQRRSETLATSQRNEVDVVRHQHVGDQSKTIVHRSTHHPLQEREVVAAVEEDVLPIHPPGDEMIDAPFLITTRPPWHDQAR